MSERVSERDGEREGQGSCKLKICRGLDIGTQDSAQHRSNRGSNRIVLQYKFPRKSSERCTFMKSDTSLHIDCRRAGLTVLYNGIQYPESRV